MKTDDPTNQSSEKEEKKILAWQIGVFAATFILFFPAGLITLYLFNGSIKYLFIFISIPLLYIGLSSIKNRVSIIRTRRHKGPSRGKSAVIFGAIALLSIVVELALIFIPALSSHFFRFIMPHPSSEFTQLPIMGSTSSFHKIKENSKFSEATVFSGISAWGDYKIVPLVLNDKTVFFAGAIGITGGSVNPLLISADWSTGEIKWQTLVGSGAITLDSNNIYAQTPNQPFDSAAGVAAYDLYSGQKKWQMIFDWRYALRIENLTFMNNLLHVATFNHEKVALYSLDPKSGAVQASEEKSGSDNVFLIDDGTAYKWTDEQLSASGKYNWKTTLENDSYVRDFELAAPVVFDNLILVKNGYWSSGPVVALRKTDGSIVWEYEHPIISNIAVGGSYTYFITENAQLMALDTQTGEILGSTELIPGFADDFDFVNTSVFIAAQNDIVAIYFEDTHQLSIIKFNSP
jgi:outer membrane protein assembly factor BamB